MSAGRPILTIERHSNDNNESKVFSPNDIVPLPSLCCMEFHVVICTFSHITHFTLIL
jgi:hypothetical protein